MGVHRRQWMPFRQPFSTASERYVKNTSSCRIKLFTLFFLFNYTTPSITALSQPFRMAAHALDWGDSLNQRHYGGKQNTMLMMFVERVVLMLTELSVPILP